MTRLLIRLLGWLERAQLQAALPIDHSSVLALSRAGVNPDHVHTKE